MFTYNPTLCLPGTHPVGSFGADYWMGSGADAGTFLYQFNSVWTIAAQFGNWYNDTTDGATLLPVYASINGYIYFTNGNYYLFYDATYGWVLKQDLLPCLEYWTYTSGTSGPGTYNGDAFWTLSSLPTNGSPISAVARGAQRGTTNGPYTGTPKTIAYAFDCWTADSTQFGKYNPQGSASGNKYFGVSKWSNGSTLYVRSVSKDSTSHFTYGAIKWNSTASKYILGTYNSATGWNESASAPVAGSSWTLTFNQPSGGTVTGSSVTLSWVGYIQGSETVAGYIQNAGVYL